MVRDAIIFCKKHISQYQEYQDYGKKIVLSITYIYVVCMWGVENHHVYVRGSYVGCGKSSRIYTWFVCGVWKIITYMYVVRMWGAENHHVYIRDP